MLLLNHRGVGMKFLKLLGLLGLLAFSACSHMTPYEACNELYKDGFEWQRYGSIEACTQQKQQDTMARRSAWKNAWAGMQKSNNQMQCTPDGLGNLNCNQNQ